VSKIISYFFHLITAKGPDRVHSPFVFDLYYRVLRNKNRFYCFDELENKFPQTDHFFYQQIFKVLNHLRIYLIDFQSDNEILLSSYFRFLPDKFKGNKNAISCLIIDKKVEEMNLEKYEILMINNDYLAEIKQNISDEFYNIKVDFYHFSLFFHRPEQVSEKFKLRLLKN
jgi:hypothetical protein